MAAPDLHTQIAALADPGLSDAERIATIRDLEDLKAHACAIQARLAVETQRLAYAIDPAAVVNRRAKAETERRVTLRPAPDTMAQLTALLPATQGVAVWATLSALADTQRAQGDPRTRGQIMADTLVERITGQPSADAVPVTINLVVSDQTLLDGGHEPAWLHDYGPRPPDHAAGLTQAAADHAIAALRRLYATPATGTLVALDSVARTFPQGLRDFIDQRDQVCRTPYCDAPIRLHAHSRAEYYFSQRLHLAA
jgi:hypothetical protein